MIRVLSLLLILSLALYWYAAVGMSCPAPLSYRIVPTIDERFGISEAEASAAAVKAVEVWESALGRDLFNEASGTSADVEIRFVFDERQGNALAEERLRENLEQKQMTSADVQAQYDSLVAEYQEAKEKHEANVGVYEERLAKHNALVASYNAAGGAPEREFDALRETEVSLTKEADALEAEAEKLQALASDINALGEQGNQLIRQYNDGVLSYNERFATEEEFTEGDYQAGNINVYTFKDKTELIKVLAHEFGHALSIEHVEGSASVMYYLLEDQPTPLALSDTDQAAFVAACGETDSMGTYVRAFINRYII